MNVVYARNDHPGILITCPNCKTATRNDVEFIGDAIKEGRAVECVACGKSFHIFVEVASIEAAQHGVQRTGGPRCDFCSGTHGWHEEDCPVTDPARR